MPEFDHIGLTTTEEQPNEFWVEQSRCWVTNPRQHPESIEFLRYAPDSEVPQWFREAPHLAFRVDRLEPYLMGQEILIEPFEVGGFAEVAFVRKHGAIFEYMRYLREGWFGE